MNDTHVSNTLNPTYSEALNVEQPWESSFLLDSMFSCCLGDTTMLSVLVPIGMSTFMITDGHNI